VRAFGSQAYGVLVRFFPCRVYINLSRCDTRLEVAACPLQSSHSMVVVFGLEDGGSKDIGYGCVIGIITVFTLPLALTSVNIPLVYPCSRCRCKYIIWLI
jgi:hypothetical protein